MLNESDVVDALNNVTFGSDKLSPNMYNTKANQPAAKVPPGTSSLSRRSRHLKKAISTSNCCSNSKIKSKASKAKLVLNSSNDISPWGDSKCNILVSHNSSEAFLNKLLKAKEANAVQQYENDQKQPEPEKLEASTNLQSRVFCKKSSADLFEKKVINNELKRNSNSSTKINIFKKNKLFGRLTPNKLDEK